ncbi:MAG: RdgB/HAM1 family non-canonical purine NTP pyrophosphatase [Bacilli bacterium]|nr:RdgB/HAM1 family non-canonical purine NTP pyrophosphatase [Bacilli bacterium]
MNKEICLATNNKGKLREYREILAPMGFVIYSLSDLNLDIDPDETGTTYRENSYIKAKAVAEAVNMPVISDDSGLEVNALDKFPGLKSSRFAKEYGGYPSVFDELNRRLEGKEDRSGQFVCCICYLESKDAKPLYFEGECPGIILPKAVGDHGFGYDPIFHSTELDMPLGVAPEEDKNRISHRAKAIKKLEIFLAVK